MFFLELHMSSAPKASASGALTSTSALAKLSDVDAAKGGSNLAERVAQMPPRSRTGVATQSSIALCELCFKLEQVSVTSAVILELEGFSGHDLRCP